MMKKVQIANAIDYNKMIWGKKDVENNMCWFLVDFWADRVYYKTVAYVTGLTYPMR